MHQKYSIFDQKTRYHCSHLTYESLLLTEITPEIAHLQSPLSNALLNIRRDEYDWLIYYRGQKAKSAVSVQYDLQRIFLEYFMQSK